MFKKLIQKWKADMDTPASEVDLLKGFKTETGCDDSGEEFRKTAADQALYGGLKTPPNGKIGVPWDGSLF